MFDRWAELFSLNTVGVRQTTLKLDITLTPKKSHHPLPLPHAENMITYVLTLQGIVNDLALIHRKYKLNKKGHVKKNLHLLEIGVLGF